MKIAATLSLPRGLPRSSSSPQSMKSKEAMTAYARKFQDFSKDIKTFVKTLEDAKKATMKSEALYREIIDQASAWTSNISTEHLNQDEISQIKLGICEKVIDFDKAYDEEILMQARKFKLSMVNDTQSVLKNAREAWGAVNHYEGKVQSLSKKVKGVEGSLQKTVNLEEKLSRNEKKLLQSINAAAQWDQELVHCAARVDQAWITVIRIMKDFSKLDGRSSSEILTLKSQIDELVVEDFVYARNQKPAQQPRSIVGDETERTAPFSSSFSMKTAQNSIMSVISSATTAASTEIGGFVFKKKTKKEDSVEDKPHGEPVSDDCEEDDVRVVFTNSRFSESKSTEGEPVSEKYESDDESYFSEGRQADEAHHEPKQDETIV